MADAGRKAAREAGRSVSAALDCGAWMCPILPGRRQPLRDAWMIGFAEGRIVRIRLANTRLPTIEINLSAFRKSVEE